MPKKMVLSNFNAIDDSKSLTYDIKTMSNVFKDFLFQLKVLQKKKFLK